MTISALPPAPQPTDSTSQFNTKAFAFLAALDTFRTEANAQAVDVNTDAGTASTAASTATAAANTATTQANNAAQSAIDANGAAVSAINAYDQFDDRYLGAKANNPALDNDGNALLTGALYWNTSVPEMRVWTGSAWQVAAGSLNANLTILREVQTAGSGQTVFNLANTYTPGLNTLMVYRNGARLLNSEYTETNLNTVTLASAATLGDELLFEIGVVTTGPTSTAGLTTFSPVGSIAAENVQAAIEELDSEKVAATGGSASGLTITGLRETRTAIGASDIDLSAGNYFTRSFTAGAVSLTISNVPASGTTASFILETTNAGLATITWPTNTRWAGGTAPTLTTSGKDILGAYTHDAGANWNFLVLGKDVK